MIHELLFTYLSVSFSFNYIFFINFLQNIDQKYIPDQNIRNVQPAFVDTNHSQEHFFVFFFKIYKNF